MGMFVFPWINNQVQGFGAGGAFAKIKQMHALAPWRPVFFSPTGISSGANDFITRSARKIHGA